MEKEITIYHVIVLDITKYISYVNVESSNGTSPDVIADTNIKEMYSFRTSEEAMDKACELIKQRYETKDIGGIKVITSNSKLVL